MFKVGDRVRCITDKYKRITLGEIYTIISLKENDFLRFHGVSHTYKSKYFETVNPKKEKEEVKKAETIKNPFKFTTAKPDYKELWSKINSSYTTSIDQFSVETIRVYTFFYLSTNPWPQAKLALLTKADFKNMLKKELLINNFNTPAYLRYKAYSICFPLSDIPSELFFTYLASYTAENTEYFSDLFGIDQPQEIKECAMFASGSTSHMILHKDRYLENFTEYIKIKPVENTVLARSLHEVEDSLFRSILCKDETHPEFKLTPLGDLDAIPF